MSTNPITETEAPLTVDPTDPTYFQGRYPTLLDLLSKGGLEGVKYCLVSGQNLRKFSQLGWSTIRDLPTLTIAGPKGVVDSVVLMGQGDPTPGAADDNGIREYFVDVDVEETVGMPANDESPVKLGNLPDGKKVQAESETRERAGAALGKGGIQIIEEKGDASPTGKQQKSDK